MPVKNSIHSDGVCLSHFSVAVKNTATETTCRRKTLFVFRVEKDKSRSWWKAGQQAAQMAAERGAPVSTTGTKQRPY